MHRVDIAIVDSSSRIPLMTWRGSASFGYGEHGAESATAQIPLERWAAFLLFTRLSASLSLRVTGGGASVWEGRVEDISINDAGATVQALGRWRAFRDSPLTAFYSTALIDQFRPALASEVAGARPERFYFETGGAGGDAARLVIATTKGTTYAAGNRLAALVYEVPDDAIEGMGRLTFDAAYNAPAAGWTFEARLYTAFGSLDTAWTVTTAGAGTVTTTVAVNRAISRMQLVFVVIVPAGYNEVNETGDNYLQITNFRAGANLGTFIATTLGTAVAAPGSATVTPGSMAGIYVGQRLYIDQQTTAGESVVVTAVTATQFTATFAKAHLAAATVRAILMYADDIVKDARDEVNAVNAGVLSTSNALIQSPGLDVVEAVYSDADAGEVLTNLAALGDTAGSRYEVGVDGSTVYFRPVGTVAQAWYVDASELEVQQTLDQLYNSVYARYDRPDGYVLRTAPQADSASITRYGITRRRAVDADTTNATVAARVAQTARDDTKNPVPRASIRFPRIYTATGAQAPLWLVRNGDTITIRNLPPVAGGAVDLIRTFRVFDVDYDAASDALSVTPETPLPLLEYLLARQEAFGDVAAGRLAGR